MNKFLRKALLVVGGVILSSTAWADQTIGDLGKGWAEAHSEGYVLSEGKSQNFTFSVTGFNSNKEWSSFVINVTKTNATAFGGANGYLFLRSVDWAYFTTDWNVEGPFNKNSFGEVKTNDVITNATIKTSVKRLGTKILIFNDITTQQNVKYRHYYEQDLGTTDDVYVFLCADNMVMNVSEVSQSDTEQITGTLLGVEDNTGVFGAGAREDFIVAPDKSLSFKFINYSNKLAILNSWTLELQQNTKYFDFGSDNRMWGDATWTGTAKVLWNTPGTGMYDWDTYIDDMYGATVVVTVKREGAKVTITALQTSTTGKEFGRTCEFTMSDTEKDLDFTARLLTEGGHLDLLPVTAEVGEYGWVTFASDYALDFSKATDGLTAYMVSGFEGNSVIKEEVTGTVPAGTGLLLKGAKGSYNIPILGSSTTNVTANKLVAGTGDEVAKEDGYTKYVLSVNSETNKAEFQRINAVSATVPVGKAYLKFEGAVSAPWLSFEGNGDATAIRTIDNGQLMMDNVYYDLSGRRVNQLTKGLYIVNGKKVIIK